MCLSSLCHVRRIKNRSEMVEHLAVVEIRREMPATQSTPKIALPLQPLFSSGASGPGLCHGPTHVLREIRGWRKSSVSQGRAAFCAYVSQLYLFPVSGWSFHGMSEISHLPMCGP